MRLFLSPCSSVGYAVRRQQLLCEVTSVHHDMKRVLIKWEWQ